jgi:hypothetical protein
VITVTLTGANAADTPLARFNWLKAATMWSDQVGPLVRGELKRVAPVGRGPDAGQLRDRIRYDRRTTGSSVSLLFGTGVGYAKYVIAGTGPHVIRAKAGRALAFQGRGGNTVFARRVNHPGTRKNDFPARALRVAEPLIQRRFSTIMRELGG